LCFAVCCSLFAGQNKTRRQLSLAAGYWRIVFARFGLSAQEHDRQPATVVVMPMSIVAVICSKHGSGFIPDEQPTCQIHLKGACSAELRRPFNTEPRSGGDRVNLG